MADASTGSAQAKPAPSTSSGQAQLPAEAQVVEAPVIVIAPHAQAPQVVHLAPPAQPKPPSAANLNTVLLLVILAFIVGGITFWLGSVIW